MQGFPDEGWGKVAPTPPYPLIFLKKKPWNSNSPIVEYYE